MVPPLLPLFARLQIVQVIAGLDGANVVATQAPNTIPAPPPRACTIFAQIAVQPNAQPPTK